MAWWKRWLARTIFATDADFWQHYYGDESWSGEPVSAAQAMQISTWFSCSRKIAQTVATLPIGIYRRLPNGDKEAISDHHLYGLLHDSPNADQTAVEFWEGRVLGVATGGNGFAEKAFVGDKLVALNRMPADTFVERKESGALVYKFYDRGKEETLPEEKVFHIRGFGDGDVGMSPVEYARQSLGLAIATEKAAGGLFSKSMRGKGFFVMPQGSKPLTADQRKDAKKSLIEANAGPDAPWAGLLEGGVDFKSVSLSSKDAELVLNRKWNVEDICRWFDMPPILIGHAQDGQTMWGSGIEQILLGWLMTGLRPYLVRTEQAIKKRIITADDRAKGIFAEFNVEGMLRADSKGRAEYNSKKVQNGALTPNEWRRLDNQAPLPGGDHLFINSTLVPIERLLAGDIGQGRPFPEDTE